MRKDQQYLSDVYKQNAEDLVGYLNFTFGDYDRTKGAVSAKCSPKTDLGLSECDKLISEFKFDIDS